MSPEIEEVERCRAALEGMLHKLLALIGVVPIGTADQFPFGWRKSAKGRTVWRLLEELISQNLELRASDLGMQDFMPAASEVGVYDFSFRLEDSEEIFVNVKSSIKARRESKDDISKAKGLEAWYAADPTSILLVSTIGIEFLEEPMGLRFVSAAVVPVMWIPDIYVNPSNNGNLQSSKYKDLDSACRRTGTEFLTELRSAIQVADAKRAARQRR